MNTSRSISLGGWTLPRPEEAYLPELLDKFRSEGYWKDETVWDLVEGWADASPDDVAVIDDTRSLTIGEVRRQALGLATALAGIGVELGDRVLVQLPNRAEALVAVAATARMGAILLPTQMAYRASEMASLLVRTEAKAMVVTDQFRGHDHVAMARELASGAPSVQGIIVLGESGGLPTFAEAIERAPYDGPRPTADDPFGVIFTSGTTALPKGCVHTSNTVLFSARGSATHMRITKDDCIFMPSPVMHTTGLVIGLLTAQVHRIPTVLAAVFEPSAALEIISRTGATLTLGATPFGVMMTDAFDPAVHDLSRFRLFGLAGAPIPSKIIARICDTLGCKVMALYGSTETLIGTATTLDDSVERISTSDGAPVPGVEIGAMDPDGEMLPAGEVGELVVRAPGRLLCYWNDAERMASTVDDEGWLHSGDLCEIDSAGYMRIRGRISDMIIRGGMNISALEVENAIISHPDVAEVAVVAMPDPRLVEKACAYVVMAHGATMDLPALQQHLESCNLAKYKMPERIEVVDVLPRNPSGKVEKGKLRDDVILRLGIEKAPA